MSNRPNNGPVISEQGVAGPVAADVVLDDGTEWAVPEETPVALIYNRRNHAVMLATPDNLADFAIGFSLAEGIIRDINDVEAVETVYQPAGIDLHITLGAERLERFDLIQRRRNLPGRAGCGLCGLENTESLTSPLSPIADCAVEINPGALSVALSALPDWQPLNARTRSVHAAVWANSDGKVLTSREDIGRHNALDKLIGALARNGQDMSEGFVIMSSRCSYELVEKAARAGLPAIATLSAPTALAIRKAREARIALHARSGGHFVRVT